MKIDQNYLKLGWSLIKPRDPSMKIDLNYLKLPSFLILISVTTLCTLQVPVVISNESDCCCTYYEKTMLCIKTQSSLWENWIENVRHQFHDFEPDALNDTFNATSICTCIGPIYNLGLLWVTVCIWRVKSFSRLLGISISYVIRGLLYPETGMAFEDA